MTRFCPYCGKQLNDRSKFCPHCGKVSPERGRHAAVAVEESPAGFKQPGAETSGLGSNDRSAYSSGERAADRPRLKPQTSVNGSAGARSDAGRRYAPRTQALVGRLEQAGFGLRYGAWMFDFLIILIALMGFTFAVSAASHRSVIGSNSDLLVVAGLTLLLFLLDFVVLAGFSGQSFGMRILGIYIVRVDGKPFRLKDALLRHLVGYPVSMAVAFLGFLWMLWDPKQQGWHDKIARTMVVMSK